MGLTGWIPDVYKYFGAANTKLLSYAQFKVALLPYLITNFGYLMKLLIKTYFFSYAYTTFETIKTEHLTRIFNYDANSKQNSSCQI